MGGRVGGGNGEKGKVVSGWGVGVGGAGREVFFAVSGPNGHKTYEPLPC